MDQVTALEVRPTPLQEPQSVRRTTGAVTPGVASVCPVGGTVS